MNKMFLFLWLVFVSLYTQMLNAFESDISIIKKGDNTDKPTLVLLSGPTDNWHSDYGWWILGQNFLAQNYQTIYIERPGQGLAKAIENPSYAKFASQLNIFLKQQQNPVIIVAFASSNLSVLLALDDKKIQKKVRGVVLLDPDVLTRHSIEHYTGESENYRKNWQQLEDYIRAGKYQERIAKKIVDERKHLSELIPSHLNQYMDWELYTKYDAIRGTDQYQLNKFKEITVYKTDLEAAKAVKFPEQIPLVILDSDFETAYLKTIKEQEVKDSITKWRDQGKTQFFELAQANRCSAYWPVNIQEHLLTYTHPELIQLAIERIENCEMQ